MLLIHRLAIWSLLVLLLIVPEVPAATVSAAQPGPECDGWQQSVVGPVERSVSPTASWWWDGTPTGQSDASGVRLSQPGQSLIIDFGRVVSGKIEVEVDVASGAPVGFSSSESLEFLAPGGDTQAYGNGEIVYKPGGGHENWHAFVRRTFRYLLVRLLQPGWIQFNHIGMTARLSAYCLYDRHLLTAR